MQITNNTVFRCFLLLALGVLFSQQELLAQSTRDPNYRPEMEPNVKTTSKKKKKVNKNSYKYKMDNAIKEYEELMKANAKKYAKQEKEMKKPQYSDPLYFGHKKKPKKRPLHKRKMCKECGIVH